MKRLLAHAALPVVLTAGMLALSGAHQAAAAASQTSQTCILGIICLPGDSSSPTSSPSSAPTASPAASPSPASASPSPTHSASAGTDPSPSADTTPSAGPTASGTPSASASPSAVASASGTAQPKKAAVKFASAAPGLVASAATSVLTAGSATLTGFVYQGNVDMPVAGGGTVTMMKFTADSITLAGGVTESVTQEGVTTTTTSPTLAFSGAVTLYATELSGSLGGIIPLTFTPQTISEILLSVANLITGVASITLTSVTTDQPLVVAGSLQTGSLSMGFGG